MKTREEIQAAIDEITIVCKKHSIVLVGTCNSEGIFGEITIENSTDEYGDDRRLIGKHYNNNDYNCDVIG